MAFGMYAGFLADIGSGAVFGYHALTFVDGNAGVTGCNVHVYSNEDIEYVRFGTLNAMSIDHDNTYGVQITGDGWLPSQETGTHTPRSASASIFSK